MASRAVNTSNGKDRSSMFEGNEKFLQEREKLKKVVEKFAKDYESSSEEEEIEAENVAAVVLKSYLEIGGNKSQLGRTQTVLENAFQSGALSCVICLASIKRTDQIWSCQSCYCSFHLNCTQRWAKDSIASLKLTLDERPRDLPPLKISWCCPNCRKEHDQNEIPQKYECFCGKAINPQYQQFLVPHSCGEICGKKLLPDCGHKCVLLCHPGPCPPCPTMVKTRCYCGSKPERMQRCCAKEWSCGTACKKLLLCGKHTCTKTCHSGECPPCPHKSEQRCQCGGETQMRDCSSPVWQCGKVCGKQLSCNIHTCPETCHPGPCGDCLLAKPRKCPCGKTVFQLPCTEPTPTCPDTCDKPLECGQHTCQSKCHRDSCGSCLQIVEKYCRCGANVKKLNCNKPFLCETKCKRLKDCLKHSCNRKCCDGHCSPCEKPCGRTLSCKNHKCPSVCHRGPCYPCPRKDKVACKCGSTVLTIPCGRKKFTKPPQCYKLCQRPPDCRHKSREPHRCHFGLCPQCVKTCSQILTCGHTCPAPCHDAIYMPAADDENVVKRAFPCPPCYVPKRVKCFGEHTTKMTECCEPDAYQCERICGRKLECGNHVCDLECHLVEGAGDSNKAGITCKQCDRICSKPRPPSCTHPCQKPCHPEECSACTQLLKMKCHCGLTALYVNCSDWSTSTSERQEVLKSCGIQCPKMYPCSHRCVSVCHSGDCNPELCKKKTKILCDCRRIKKEVTCDQARANSIKIECDAKCVELQKLKEEKRKIEEEAKMREEMLKNQKELEEFERKFSHKKRIYKEKKQKDIEKKSLNIWFLIVPILSALILALILYSR